MKSYKTFLEEKRAHAEQNPRLSAYDQLLPYKDDPNVYISMTEVNKVGINPQSTYNTPLGIYTYPLKQAWTNYRIGTEKSLRGLPWQSNVKFVQVVRATNVLDVSQYTQQDLNRDSIKLQEYLFVKMLKEKLTILRDDMKVYMQWWHNIDKEFAEDIDKTFLQRPTSAENIKYYVDLCENFHAKVSDLFDLHMKKKTLSDKERNNIEFQLSFAGTNLRINKKLKSKANEIKSRMFDTLLDSAKFEAYDKSPGGIFWWLTMMVAKTIHYKDIYSANTTETIVQWNKIFRMLGYTGISDKTGKGIIHTAEPVQAVFFTTKGFKHIDTIRNVDYSEKSSNVTAADLPDIPDFVSFALNPQRFVKERELNISPKRVQWFLKNKQDLLKIGVKLVPTEENVVTFFLYLLTMGWEKNYPMMFRAKLKKIILNSYKIPQYHGSTENVFNVTPQAMFLQDAILKKYARHLQASFERRDRDLWDIIRQAAKENRLFD